MMKFAEIFQDPAIVAPLVRQLSWSHFLILLPLKTQEARLFYARQSIEQLWSKRELIRQIERKAFERAEIADSKLELAAAPELVRPARDRQFMQYRVPDRRSVPMSPVFWMPEPCPPYPRKCPSPPGSLTLEMKPITWTAHRTGTEFLTLIVLLALAPSAQLVAQERTNDFSLGRLYGKQTAPQRLFCCRRLRSDRIPGLPGVATLTDQSDCLTAAFL
jgi:hypothetical protein